MLIFIHLSKTQLIVSAATISLTVVISWFCYAYRKVNDPRLGPGPTLFPWIGRIHDLPIRGMWLKFKEWGDKYGQHGFYRTQMLGTKVLIVTDERVAHELLVRHAKYNSDRPAVPSLFDSKSTHGSVEYLPLMGRNQYWSRQRRATHSYLTEAATAHYHGVMDFEAKRWLARLLQDPDDFLVSLEDMAAKVMCQLTWDDPSLSEALRASAWGLLRQMSPAGPITNVLTPLWRLPERCNPWKRAERRRHDEQRGWWTGRLAASRERLGEGRLRPCWTREWLEETSGRGRISGDDEASCMLGMLALVGVFTVAGPLGYWLIAMVLHPQWQEAVQREVDEQCGGCLPTLGDKPRMPILRACIKETMRWRPNVPTGVAHEAERDFEFQGYLVPKGTRILPLDLAFLRNPQKYPDPESFRPERWLEPGWPTYQEPLSEHPTIKGMTSFGWGQRQCLGMAITQDELFLACGALAWCFTLLPKRDPVTGANRPVSADRCNSLLIIKPDPFEMAFEPRPGRGEEALALWEEAEAKDRQARENFWLIQEVAGYVEEKSVGGHPGVKHEVPGKKFYVDGKGCPGTDRVTASHVPQIS